jgi:hypothetical protein
MEVIPIYCNISRKETKTCSKEVTSYFTKETITDERKHIAAKEGLFAFHKTKHSHSF